MKTRNGWACRNYINYGAALAGVQRQAIVLLLYHPPLGELSKQRLAVVRASNDGFLIAEEDLKIRGPGELLGSRQSGSLDFRVADLLRDSDMLLEVRTVAEQMFRSDRQAVDAIIQRWMRFPDQLSQV